MRWTTGCPRTGRTGLNRERRLMRLEIAGLLGLLALGSITTPSSLADEAPPLSFRLHIGTPVSGICQAVPVA